MIRAILKTETNTLTIELPNYMVGKTIQVIAYVTDDTSLEFRVAELRDKLSKFSFNSGGHRFDRDYANDYE